MQSRFRAPAIVIALAGMLLPCLRAAYAEDEALSARAEGELELPVLSKSLSCGATNRGALIDAVEMPRSGVGFEVPEPWWSRGYRYGTAELVELILRAAAAVETEFPGAKVGVADLSRATGGALPRHRSHQSGRDVDIIFYALDPGGQPLPPDQHMAYFTGTGRAHYAKAPEWSRAIPERYFDLARNWALIRALIHDRYTPAQAIFVSARVRRWLLDYARATGEPDELIDLAAHVLRRAVEQTHNDHMHVRIPCPPDDLAMGRCRESQAPPRHGQRKYHSRVRCPARPRALPES